MHKMGEPPEENATGRRITPPLQQPPHHFLSKLTIPDRIASYESRPSSSSSNTSLFLTSSPASPTIAAGGAWGGGGIFMSPPATPVKSPPSRNDIFSEDNFSSITPTSFNLSVAGTNTPTSSPSSMGGKESLKGLGLLSATTTLSPSVIASGAQGAESIIDFDAWNSDARKRRSG